MQVDLNILMRLFNQLQRKGVVYSYGGKADKIKNDKGQIINPDTDGTLNTSPDTINGIDCSGFSRYSLFQATSGNLLIPDGSQNQREYFEGIGNTNNIQPISDYSNVDLDVGTAALYICFIKPWTNGCGKIGHVWQIYKPKDGIEAVSLESHGGGGVATRRWDNLTFTSEFYSGFRLPVTY